MTTNEERTKNGLPYWVRGNREQMGSCWIDRWHVNDETGCLVAFCHSEADAERVAEALALSITLEKERMTMTRTIDNKMGLEWRDRIIVPGQIADCGEVRITIFPSKRNSG